MKPRISVGIALWSVLCSAPALAGTEEVFALIVTNNRSFTLERPDLQYADDDGARYHGFFRMVAEEGNITLLSRFDDPTRRLYPDLGHRVRPPRDALLTDAIRRLKQRVNRAKAMGKKTAFYFVFAGHGHVDHGKGYLELDDARLGPGDLERRILDQVEADVVHVVLDSCNSFFVINPRKPGGKRWATPRDMTRGFSKRYPHVGVVLSTNSAAEVYEWSEIASGIFSHEIRSGMSGAADANADQRVSYDEIDAFVATANLGIRNEAYMPKVYIRGPWNNGATSFLDLRTAKGRRLRFGAAERRLWIRDAQGVRLVDLRKERGADISVTLPCAPHDRLYIREQYQGGDGRWGVKQYVTPEEGEGGAVSFNALRREPVDVASRGHDAVFQMIFAHPFGPRAFDAHLRQRRNAPEAIFGISEADRRRMGHYLKALARSDRQRRHVWGGLSGSVGVVMGVSGALALTEKERDLDEYLFGGISLGCSALLIGIGAYQLFVPSRGERTYEMFLQDVDRRPRSESDAIVARTEAHLEEIRRRERTKRYWMASMLYLAGSAAIGAGIFFYVHPDVQEDDSESRMTFGTLYLTAGLVNIGLGISLHFMETTVERMLRLYREDPDLNLSFTLAPTRGGLAAGLTIGF